MDFSKQNEFLDTLLEFVDNVKDKVKDGEYLKAMNSLKGLKLNLEGQEYSQFVAFNILLIQAESLPEQFKTKFEKCMRKSKETEFFKSAFKDVETYMKAIGKPLPQLTIMLMQPSIFLGIMQPTLSF
jgi:hypothetical protein